MAVAWSTFSNEIPFTLKTLSLILKKKKKIVLRLNVPVNNFSVMLGRSQFLLGINQYCRELMCLAQGHNTVTPVGIKTRTSRFGVYSATMPSPSLKINQRTIGPENAHLKPDLGVLSHNEMTLTLNTHTPLLTSLAVISEKTIILILIFK